MTNPGGSSGLNPGQWGVTADGSVPGMADRDQATVTQTLQDGFTSNQWPSLGDSLIALVISFIVGGIAAILGGFSTIIEAITGTVDNDYVAQLPIVNDHTQQITELQEAFDQLLLQGNAIVFTGPTTYTPTAGIVACETILLGAGGGGGGGRWDFIAANRSGGGGGGGGGEIHYRIPATLLPQSGGHFTGIAVGIGAGGAGGIGSESPGTGGGNTTFGSVFAAGGGQGGFGGHSGSGAQGGQGGAGMIPGGNGGKGAGSGDATPWLGGNSTSAYDLHGGGGGGGGGGVGNAVDVGPPGNGGIGGVSPGGLASGGNGTAPAAFIATGGGGGGGGGTQTVKGGNGAAPSGGGGGGCGGISAASNGGNGGNGIAYAIERFA